MVAVEETWRGSWMARIAAAVLMPQPGAPASDIASRMNMALLVQLRWIAVAGQIATMAGVELLFGIDLPLRDMGLVLAALAAFNLANTLWLRGRASVSNPALMAALLFDVAALTIQLWLSGGATNPFVSLYLLQVSLAAILLDATSIWIVLASACACVVLVTMTYRPLVMPAMHGDVFSLRIYGMLVCLLLNAVLLVVFVTRMSRNLRERDARLAALRQHAAEESHIVRMGLLATGAAHELGTPLSSLSVILGDWKHLPTITGDPEMAQDLKEMQAAIARCKAIVSGILLSAGEARGEASAVTSLQGFIAGIVEEWKGGRGGGLELDVSLRRDIPIAFDTVVKQAIFNLLDNAREVSPDRVVFSVREAGGMLSLTVTDAGPGFPAAMLIQIGKPYQSSKGQPGRGLGLFLSVNVARKLGGHVAARNLPGGGAQVTMTLPLAALAIPESAHV